MGVRFRQSPEQRNIQPAFVRARTLDEWRELEVVADQDEFVGKSKWSKTIREGALRCFVHDTDVKCSAAEEGTANKSKSGPGQTKKKRETD